MLSGPNTNWDSVSRWSPTLFLIGGALLAGHAALLGIETFTTLTPPPDVFVTTGHLVALVGLVGLYPVLADRTPKLARAAGAVAVVPLVGWVGMTVAQLLAVVGVASTLTDILPGPVIMLVLGSTILTYGLFGAATLRTGEGSRIVGGLVLGPAVLLVALLADEALTGVSPLDGVLIAGGLTLSMMALGYRLRTWDRSTERATPTGDATAG